jgi:hypothetical protein
LFVLLPGSLGRVVFYAESFFEGISEIGATFAGKKVKSSEDKNYNKVGQKK